ncbi:MAG TPA: hypothetical protein VGR06_00055 [Actinophytocola sp.]|jgi:hypothetical protein|uniref:hypothetical protein n=1 Tax=Actinophytocola sp. TaxID=1872138 RepID=UPI002E093B0D|nr:hypothetical protein [Actinophytocola sp.]
MKPATPDPTPNGQDGVIRDAGLAGRERQASPDAGAVCWAIAAAGHGAPGATTVGVAVAAAVAGLLVEADIDGGVLGARYGCWLHDEAPSLASLVASLRPGVTAAAVNDHVQLLPSGVRAVLLPPSAEDAAGAVEHLAFNLDLLRAALPGGRLVLDLGRLHAAGTALDLASAADAVVVVARPTVEELAGLLARMPHLAARFERLAVAIRGDGPYRQAEIRAEAAARAGRAVPVVTIPEDPRTVRGLAVPPEGRRAHRLERSPLMRAVRELCNAFRVQETAEAGEATTAESAGRPAPGQPAGVGGVRP